MYHDYLGGNVKTKTHFFAHQFKRHATYYINITIYEFEYGKTDAISLAKKEPKCVS